MNLTELFETHRSAVIGVAAAALLLSGLLTVRNLAGPANRPGGKWMFDLDTQTLVAADFAEPAPGEAGAGRIALPFGPAGSLVDAHVYTCGDAADLDPGMGPDQIAAAGARLVYVSVLTPPARGGDVTVRLVAAPDVNLAGGRGAWVPEFVPAGQALRGPAFEPCPDGTPARLTRPV